MAEVIYLVFAYTITFGIVFGIPAAIIIGSAFEHKGK